MTKCLIVGCNLFDEVNGRWVHGDLHEVGNCFVFNACTNQADHQDQEGVEGESAWNYGSRAPDRVLNLLSHAQTFERRGVIVVDKNQTSFNIAAANYLTGTR